MGTFFQTFAIPARQADDLKSLVTSWLAAKGFQPTAAPRLFPTEFMPQPDEGERSVCFFSNERWTVVSYSHIDVEGERLKYEFDKLNEPLLKVWCHDSDLWGYEISRHGEPLAAFCSNPHYFGAIGETPLATNGDAELLCRLCHAEGKEGQIERIQRRRALFSEGPCREFCAALGAAPAGLGYRDVEEAMSAIPPRARVGDFDLEHIRLVRPGEDQPEQAPALHSMSFEPAEAPSEPHEMPPEWAAYARRAQLVARFWGLLLWPIFFLLAIAFRFWFRLYRFAFFRSLRERRVGEHGRAINALFEQFAAAGRPVTRRHGNELINEIHRCRITLPAGAEAGGGNVLWVFNFRVGDFFVHCQANRPEQIRRIFRLPDHVVIADDEKFFVGGLQARSYTHRSEMPDASFCSYLWLVQTPRAVYQFMLSSLTDVPPEIRSAARATVESFRMLDGGS